MLEKLGYKIIELLKILFIFKPEESYKEIFESLNYLDKELDSIYYSSFEVEALFEYYVNKNRLAEIEEEIQKYQEVIDKLDKDNYKLYFQIATKLLIFSGLSLVSVILGVVILNPLASLILFLVNFFIAYRLAVVSDKVEKVIKEDKKSQTTALSIIERMKITCGNIFRNLEKRKPVIEAKVTRKLAELDVWEKAQEVLNNYLDYGSLPMMSDEVMAYLKKMLEHDLGVEDDNIFSLLELAKAKDLENKNLTLEKNFT